MAGTAKGLSRDLAQIALDNDTSIQALVGEAIDLLLRQYGKASARREIREEYRVSKTF